MEEQCQRASSAEENHKPRKSVLGTSPYEANLTGACQRKSGDARREHQDQVRGEFEPPPAAERLSTMTRQLRRGLPPKPVADQEQESPAGDGHDGQQKRRADQPPRARSERSDTRAQSKDGHDDHIHRVPPHIRLNSIPDCP
jgi:hypothetical protein